MNITEYKLTITSKDAFEDTERVHELIYRGNENIIIKVEPIPDLSISDQSIQTLLPRHILETFVRLINEQ